MAEKFTKADLIESLSHKTTMTRKEIHEIIDSLWEEIKRAMLSGKTIELRGFGTFKVKIRKGREHARNPKTGTVVSVEDHGVSVFIPGKELKKEARGFKANL